MPVREEGAAAAQPARVHLHHPGDGGGRLHAVHDGGELGQGGGGGEKGEALVVIAIAGGKSPLEQPVTKIHASDIGWDVVAVTAVAAAAAAVPVCNEQSCCCH